MFCWDENFFVLWLLMLFDVYIWIVLLNCIENVRVYVVVYIFIILCKVVLFLLRVSVNVLRKFKFKLVFFFVVY